MRTIQSWTCELGYGTDTMFHRTYFLLLLLFYPGAQLIEIFLLNVLDVQA